MLFKETVLKGVYIIQMTPYQDERGLFGRTYCQKEFEQIAHHRPFVQINHSLTKKKGTIRGMHFQHSPFTEAKLIRCIQGKVWDVMVDIRQGSPTFLHYIGVELSAENMYMVYIPEGVAHGFQTLTDDAAMIYHHTNWYAPNSEGGLRYDDPKINIQWPLQATMLSEKDLKYPLVDAKFKGIKTT